MKIENINQVKKNVGSLSELVNSVWWSQTKNENGTYAHDAFYPLVQVYTPGFFNNWLNEAVYNKRFSSETIIDNEIDKYKKGFIEGYKEGRNEKNNFNYLAGVILSFASQKPIPVKHIKDKDNKKVIEPLNWLEYGNRVGLYYFAWIIALKNQKEFEALFTSLSQPDKIVERHEIPESNFLKNYESFVSLFKLFGFKCEAENFKLNERSISNFQNLLPLGKAEILIQSAKEEIKPLALTQNNNIDNLRKKLNSDLTEMGDLLNNIIDANTNEIKIENSKESLAFLEIKNVFLLFKDLIIKYIKLTPHHTEMKTATGKTPITLSSIITHKKSIEIVDGIKIQYKNIKGKNLKLLLMALQDLELLPRERIANCFHRCCKLEFCWKTASYNAMNGYKFNDATDKAELDSMKNYLKTIIRTE